jgi:hypothetical protein
MLIPVALGVVSIALIVAGLFVVLRDQGATKVPSLRSALRAAPAKLRQMRADTIGQRPDHGADSEVTIVRRATERSVALLTTRGRSATSNPVQRGGSVAFEQLRSAITDIGAEASADHDETLQEGQRWPVLEDRWLTVEPVIEGALAQLNDVLRPVAMEIGPQGETGWSFKNRGFGAYRRVMVTGKSVAWLRCELGGSGQIVLKVRAHAPEQAMLNAGSTIAAEDATPINALEALSKTVRPTAEFAAWLMPKRRADAEAGLDAWAEIQPLTADAFTLASTALRQAGAELLERAPPAWDADTGRQRWLLAVHVGGRERGTLTLDLIKRALEVSADVPGRNELARRQRVDLEGLTPHSLAEAMASCVWPAVADALETANPLPLGYAG